MIMYLHAGISGYPKISAEVFIATTLSCSIAFALIGGLIGLVCGIKCTTMRQQAAAQTLNPEEMHQYREKPFELIENVAYASVKRSVNTATLS